MTTNTPEPAMKASKLRSLFPKDASGQWYANPALVIYLVNNAEAIAELIEAAESVANPQSYRDHLSSHTELREALAKIKE